MIASAIIQSILLLSSGAFNVLLNPGSLTVEKQLFVSSVILMIGFAQGFCLVIFKVVIRKISGYDPQFGSSYLFAPLTNAMSNSINDRPGETDVITPIVTRLPPRDTTNPKVGSVDDGFDTDDEDFSATATHFMPELELEITERRNVYTDIYLLGIATFTTTYCIDTVSPAPTTAFLSGLLIMSIAQSINIIIILTRTGGDFVSAKEAIDMRGKRLLTVMSCIFATGAFIMFCVALGNENVDVSSVNSIFDVTFSVVLPLITPWLLVTVSPKTQPLRTLFECTPFVFTICFSFVLFFLATRGQISTIVHALAHPSGNSNYSVSNSTTQLIISDSLIDLEFHSDVNASIHFNMDIFSTTSVDSAGNIPMLLIAPIIKIPTIVVVLANVINRSNLVVITALMVTMSLREIGDVDTDLSTRRAYCVSLVLSVMSLIFNVVKYLKLPDWIHEAVHMKQWKSPPSDEGVSLESVDA
jgi:hypothetical protein